VKTSQGLTFIHMTLLGQNTITFLVFIFKV